jgi:septal ring factor EnvC (AmiA/AmiB activator)
MDWLDSELGSLKDQLRQRAAAIAEREAELDQWERELERRETRLARQRVALRRRRLQVLTRLLRSRGRSGAPVADRAAPFLDQELEARAAGAGAKEPGQAASRSGRLSRGGAPRTTRSPRDRA